MKNFVTIDWITGPDRIFFFFKDTNTYSRFNLGDNQVEKNHPTTVEGRWGDFAQHVKDLRFGFNTSSPDWKSSSEGDMVWFFYYQGGTPMACKYSQLHDKVVFKKPVADTDWWPIGNFFDKIVGVMRDKDAPTKHTYCFLLNDGRYFEYSPWLGKKPKIKSMQNSIWAALEPYKDRIITTAMNDYPAFSVYFYIFLTNKEYLRIELSDRKLTGPFPINGGSWPGLIT